MSKEVKRYSPDTNGRMREWPDGDYVTSDDYDALRLELAEANADFVRIANEREALLAERDALRDTLEHIRDTIDGQLTLIAQRAPGKYLDKTPIVRCLRLHRTRADEAIAALQGEQP